MELRLVQAKRIEKETGLLCLDDCIATVAEYYDTNYEMMYIGGCQLCSLPGQVDFSKRYEISIVGRMKNLKYYHGLSFKEQSYFFVRNAVRKIRREIAEGRPVMVLFNPYFCPWDDGYQKYDANPGHCFLIRGIANHEFICADPYFYKETVHLSFSLFRKGIQAIYFFSYHSIENISKEKLQSALIKMFSELITHIFFWVFRNFIEDAEQCPDLFCNIERDEDLWIDSYIILLLKINQGIQNIAVVTEYVAEQTGRQELSFASEHLWNMAVQWKQARKLTAKLYFIHRPDKKLRDKIFARMKCVIEELEELSRKIESGKWESKLKNSHVESKTAKSEVCLYLKPYYNNRACVLKDRVDTDYKKADFSSVRTCYVIDKTEVRKNHWEFNGAKLQMAALGADIYDNVSCDGQKIEVPCGNYRKIVLAGASEFGSSSDILRLYDTEGEKYQLIFEFTDYIYEPQFEETVLWKGRGIHATEDGYDWMKESLYLYVKTYDIPERDWAKIELPINPSIHIFAITLLPATRLDGKEIRDICSF